MLCLEWIEEYWSIRQNVSCGGLSIKECETGSLPTTMVSGLLHVFSNGVKGSIKAVTSETVGKRESRQRLPNPHYQPATRSLFDEAKDMTRCVRSRGLNHNFQPMLQKMSTIRWNTNGGSSQEIG